MALSFDGTSFVGIDDEAVGDGTALTEALDAALEACLANNHIHLGNNLDCASWEPYTICTATTSPEDVVRPYASLGWQTIAPPARLPILPGQTGIEFRYGYQVRDFGDNAGTSNTLDYFLRFVVPGLGSVEEELASTSWTGKTTVLTFNQSIETMMWLPVHIYGRSEIYETTPLATDSKAVLYIKGAVGSTIYTAGNGSSEPNATTPGIQATKLTNTNGDSTWHDHVVYDDRASLVGDVMVLNPAPVTGSIYQAETHSLSYIQHHGFNYLPTFDVAAQ